MEAYSFSELICPVSLYIVVVLQSVATLAITPVVVVVPDFQHFFHFYGFT